MELNHKLTILNQIYENKAILFGRFNDTLTHVDKINKWKDIGESLRALGIFNKDWKYLRDTTWQNWRKRTTEKKDNRSQTGSGGGRKFRYDDCDEVVLKIIGKDSPVIDGFPIPEASGTDEAAASTPKASSSTAEDMQASIETNETPRTPAPCKSRKSVPRISVCESDMPDELMKLKIQKMELEIELSKAKIEIAKREQHKLDLEILKMERVLKIQQPSSFTLPFYLQNVVVAENNVIAQDDVVVEQDAQNNSDILQRAIVHIISK